MSRRALAWAKEQRLGSPIGKAILMCLAGCADPKTAELVLSRSQLMADAEVSERSLRYWLPRLEQWGLIARPDGVASAARDSITLRLDARVLDGAERLDTERRPN